MGGGDLQLNCKNYQLLQQDLAMRNVVQEFGELL